MKIGVSTLALFPMSLEDILDYLVSIDVKYCELMLEYPYNHIDHDIVNSYSIETSIHAPLSDVNIASLNDSIRKASVEEVKNSINLASKIGSEAVVVHPGHMAFLARKFQEKIRENSLISLKECSRFAEEHGIKLCVENMPDMEGMICKGIDELNELVQEIGALMTVDVGHAHNVGISIDEILKYDTIGHFHLSDNDGSFDNHNAVGSKDIDFKSLFEGLNKKKFNGILVVEVTNKDEILESLNYIKKLTG
ncbi:sugar phosphate isomerase/epimerase family protein [Methanobacterium sp.]|uniref:sugar phosphate isomerase/epimerase family protein n=1 Tax=Methanobacterium sp. TaxID=2164 RepID=UPI003C73479E